MQYLEIISITQTHAHFAAPMMQGAAKLFQISFLSLELVFFSILNLVFNVEDFMGFNCDLIR